MMYQNFTECHDNASQTQTYDLQSINHLTPLQQPNPMQLIPPYAFPGNAVGGSTTSSTCAADSMVQLRTDHYGNYVSQATSKSNDPYRCNFLLQLEGTYEVESAEEEKIHVQLVNDDGCQYALARRTFKAKEHVKDWEIYEEASCFTLRSLEGFVLAVMAKGMDMKRSVSWFFNDGNTVRWRRTTDVTFSLVTITPDQSRRNSLTSNVSEVSQMSYSQMTPFETSDDVGMHIRSELRPKVEYQPVQQSVEGLATASLDSSSPTSANVSLLERKLSEDDLFTNFQKFCAKRPSLLQKMTQWGISRTPSRVGEMEVSELAAGRIWVRATLSRPTKHVRESCDALLNEISGAYQEGEADIYLQPPSQPNEPGRQHRLSKSHNGFWLIEEYIVEKGSWCPCAKEQSHGLWVDCKNRSMKYKIQVVPMLSILNRMRDQWADFEEMEKRMEFLFNSCNPKKLNTKLKARNLKHNISNLKLKLDKQYSLSFAVNVSELADCIALESQSEGSSVI